MDALQRVALLQDRYDVLKFMLLFVLLLTISLSLEYYQYKKIILFDSYLTTAEVQKQYTKTKQKPNGKIKEYQVLKLKSDEGFSFYTIASKKTPNYKKKELQVEFSTDNLTFLNYLKTFFAFSRLSPSKSPPTLKTQLNQKLQSIHTDPDVAALYEALFLATPLPYGIQEQFSKLGIMHLLALSGFHLSVLFALLFFLLKKPYALLQQRYFPYRSQKRDLFFIIASLLLAYLLFVGSPPSLLRAYAMLVVAFVLYERGVVIFSMQTLLLSALLLLALFPRLLFSAGFFLSISGVFYIFAFFQLFDSQTKLFKTLLLPFWIYFMMLPFSLVLFANFSLYHPLSTLLTALFSIFYPLTLLAHLFGFGAWSDTVLSYLLHFETNASLIVLPNSLLYLHIVLSLVVLWRKNLLPLLLLESLSLFIYAVYNVAEF
jgi:competence protein ComEC